MPCELEETAALAADQIDQRLDLPEGVPPLTSLYLYIAGACNLACRHCWITPTYQRGDNGGQFIKLEHVKKAIREAKPLGLTTVKLTGGEPVLHPHFRELVTLIADAGLQIIIETNGTLIDDALAEFMRQTGRVSFISVSLDGATAGTHDAMRAVDGSYGRALDGVRALVGVGYRPQLICTLHRGNVSEIADLVALAEGAGCGSVKFNHVQKIGRGEQFAQEQGLELTEIIELYRTVVDDIMPGSQVQIYFDIPYAFRPIRRLLNDPAGYCTVRNILGMLAGGELSLCGIGVTIPDLIYGHIERDDLGEVWCHSPGLIRLREQIPAQLEGICGQCLYQDRCLGACVANNYHVSGRLNTAYYFCNRAEALGLFPASRTKG